MPNIFQDEIMKNQDDHYVLESIEDTRLRQHYVSNRKQYKGLLDGLPTGRVELLAVTAIIFMMMWLFGWSIAPFNKVNHLTISGNQLVESDSIIASTGIRAIDSTKSVLANRKEIEKTLITENPIIASVVFERPNWIQLNVSVVENQVVGLVKEEGVTYPLLENGELLDLELNSIEMKSEWQTLPVIDSNHQKGRLIELASVLKKVDESILKMIDTIVISTDQSKPNAIELTMNDGHHVKAITQTFAEKIIHYPNMKEIIGNQMGTINLEVGAYFTPELSNANSVKLDANIDN